MPKSHLFLGSLLCLLLSAASPSGQALKVEFGDYPPARHGGNYMHNFYLPPSPSTTPWAPAWSPDGRYLAVSMAGSIWRVDIETGAAAELTYDRKYHSLPDWSPDGRWIVYTADDGGNTIHLQILDLETGASHPLTEGNGLYLDPAFSPDGSKLAYVSTQPNGYFGVFVRQISRGEWAGPEIAITADNDYGNDRLYFGPWDMHITPAWLPNNDELLLVSNRGIPLGSGNVLRVPVEPQGILKAQTVLREQTLYRARPHVSLDGKRFVYSSTRGAADQYNNLYVQPTTGGEPYKLTFFPHDAFNPRWSPDGEWIVFNSNQGGLPHLELLETYGGQRRVLEISERRWRRPMGYLKVQTRLAVSGRQTPARIHLVASDGKFYAPNDSYARVTQEGRNPIFHEAGEFLVQLPVGNFELLAMKGFEHQPARASGQIRENQVEQLKLELEPVTDMGARGWYSGSTHVHMNYAGNLHNTLENLLFMSDAEDQDIVNEQVANKDNRILDYQFFIPGGRPHPLSSEDRILVVGQEYRPPFYGHVFMLGLRDHLISPFTTGYEGTAIESLYPSNTDMLRKAKAQGATVGYVHAFGGDSDPLEGSLGGGKGFIVDAALGATDAVEWSQASEGGFFPWFAALNSGLRVTAVGGEDSISNLHISKLVGSVRTYVYTGARGLDMGAWFEGLREGRAFVSTGPLIELFVEGARPGQEIELSQPGKVTVSALVQSITPLKNAQVIFNGQSVADLPFQGDRLSMHLETSIEVDRSGWIIFRATGDPEESFPLDSEKALAFTNPVYVTVGDQPVRDAAAADYCLRWIDKLETMALEWPGWRSEREKEQVLSQFNEAREIYRRLKAEAP